MQNLAIVLGVSEYNHAPALSACKNDADNMHRLLQATEKYQILQLDQNLSKAQMLGKIEGFLKVEDEEKIGELLFYFSGHGHQDESGTHFILKDTELSRINATSLNNSEIDDLARNCNPELFVKIIDACHSGLTYIKSLDENDDAFEEKNWLDCRTEKAFENCIFMSSSKRNETSAASQQSSFFTDVFIDAVLDGTKEDVVRYSDIQNYIRDEFSSNKYEQTPYFNTQSDGRAVFATTTPALKKLAEEHANMGNEVMRPEQESELEGNIERFLNAYRTEEAVKEIIEKMEAILQQEQLPLSWIDKYYNIRIANLTKRDFEEDNGILKFLYERYEKENLYIEMETERVREKLLYDMGFGGYKTVPVRFTSKVHRLPSNMSVSLNPENDGLPRYVIDFVFVYSDTGMYIFQGVRQLVCKGWAEYVTGDKKKYTYKWLKYAEFDEASWQDYVQKRLEESAEFIEKSLSEFVE